jgi:hypothetical protein
VVVVVAALVAGGCGGADDQAQRGFVASSLSAVPAGVVTDQGYVVVGDVDAAARIGGIDRPDPADFDELEYADWVLDLGGVLRDEGVMLLLPEEISWPDDDDLADEVGFTPVDIASFLTVVQTPESLSFVAGVSAGAIDAALGERNDRGMWQIGEGTINPDDRTEFRPLGEEIFLGSRDGLIAWSRSEEIVETWLAADDSLLDEEAYRALAKHLDDTGVYSAVLVASERFVSAPPTELSVVRPWRGVAVGLVAAADSGIEGVIVYHHDSADDAAANAEVIGDEFANGESAFSQQRWTELVDVQSVDARGSDLVVRVQLDEPRLLFEILFRQEPILTAGLAA